MCYVKGLDLVHTIDQHSGEENILLYNVINRWSQYHRPKYPAIHFASDFKLDVRFNELVNDSLLFQLLQASDLVCPLVAHSVPEKRLLKCLESNTEENNLLKFDKDVVITEIGEECRFEELVTETLIENELSIECLIDSIPEDNETIVQCVKSDSISHTCESDSTSLISSCETPKQKPEKNKFQVAMPWMVIKKPQEKTKLKLKRIISKLKSAFIFKSKNKIQ
jgi:hypothetical protein